MRIRGNVPCNDVNFGLDSLLERNVVRASGVSLERALA